MASIRAPPSIDCPCSLEGKELSEYFLCGGLADFSPFNLRKNCLGMGMDCSAFYFYHCDLGPANVLVDTRDNTVSIIDWEIAGFVPIEWVRTKFRVSGGMDLSSVDDDVDWRRRMIHLLGEMGYTDVVDNFVEWRKKR